MPKVSQELSKDYNRHEVGLKGGKTMRDLNNPQTNIMPMPQPMTPEINPPNKLGNPGAPDRELFSSSED